MGFIEQNRELAGTLIPFQPEMPNGYCRGGFPILDIFESALVLADVNHFVRQAGF